MHRNSFFALSFVLVLAALVVFSSCKSEEKKRADAKQELIANIAHYGIEPVDTTGKAPLASADANEVLVHYPEFYHAVDNAKRLYDKWAAEERKMISTAFVGKGAKRTAEAKKLAAALDSVIEARSITSHLDYVLFEDERAEQEEWTGNSATSDLYLALIAKVADGLGETADHAKSDDIKTSIGFARRMWADYAECLQRITPSVPEPSRARYIKVVNEIVRQHYIDLLNRYYNYYETETPGWLLPYDATDDAIQNFTFGAFHDRDWIE